MLCHLKKAKIIKNYDKYKKTKNWRKKFKLLKTMTS